MIHFGEQWYLWKKTVVIDLIDLEMWRGKWEVGVERTGKEREKGRMEGKGEKRANS